MFPAAENDPGSTFDPREPPDRSVVADVALSVIKQSYGTDVGLLGDLSASDAVGPLIEDAEAKQRVVGGAGEGVVPARRRRGDMVVELLPAREKPGEALGKARRRHAEVRR